MADAKARLEDKDEWIFDSLSRYTHLYMFDLEFPVDAFEVINDTSLCLAGLQTYSKNCELVQLSIPPKLLPSKMEDGLCKDRDFNIISGGYSPNRITQIKSVHSNPKLLATVQTGKAGVSLFELGDENHAVIIPRDNLSLPRLSSASVVQVIATQGNQIVLGSNSGNCIYEWKLDSPISSTPSLQHEIPERFGGITKIKFWDENSMIFLTNKGAVATYDLRGKQIGVEIQSSKSDIDISTPGPGVMKSPEKEEKLNLESKNQIQKHPTETNSANPESLQKLPIQSSNLSHMSFPNEPTDSHKRQSLTPDQSRTPSIEVNPASLLWSFDSVPPLHRVGIVDSCGGYETFDIRKTTPGQQSTSNRILLPGCTANEILGQKFNFEYEPYLGFGSEVKFILTGMKDENVLVYSDRVVGGVMEVSPVFTHDGHSSTVTHALWHPLTKNLLFSTSANSTLHAWQYIQR